jgi:hypothetical protein
MLRRDNRAVYDTPQSIDQIVTALAEQPKAIASVTSDLSEPRLHAVPDRGEWSLNDVLAHLRACSDTWGRYIATILADDRPTIKAMNPTTWITHTDYRELEFAPSLRAFRRQRARLLTLLRSLPTSGWSRAAIVTGAGRPRDVTVIEYARRLANHERSHVKHIERLAGASRGARVRPRR